MIPFAEFCILSLHEKKALDASQFSDTWNSLPQGAQWGLIGGGLGAASGLFSDTPIRSTLKRGLLGGLLGAGASAAAPGISSLFQGHGSPETNPDPTYLPGGNSSREEAALGQLNPTEPLRGPVQPGQSLAGAEDRSRTDAMWDSVAEPSLPAQGQEIRGGLGPISQQDMWDSYTSAAGGNNPHAPPAMGQSNPLSLLPNNNAYDWEVPESRMEGRPFNFN
jgi:hypothetical protein